MKIFRKIRQFLSLRVQDRRLFFWTLILLPITELRLRAGRQQLNLSSFIETTRTEPALQPDDEQTLTQARRTTKLMLQAGHYSPVQGRCLTQSLVLQQLLKRQGIEANIRIGVSKTTPHLALSPSNFEAHAWVECQGEILNERLDVYDRFVVLEYPQKLAV